MTTTLGGSAAWIECPQFGSHSLIRYSEAWLLRPALSASRPRLRWLRLLLRRHPTEPGRAEEEQPHLVGNRSRHCPGLAARIHFQFSGIGLGQPLWQYRPEWLAIRQVAACFRCQPMEVGLLQDRVLPAWLPRAGWLSQDSVARQWRHHQD